MKNSKSKVNDIHTPPSLHRLNELDEPNRFIIPVTQLENIWKSSKGVCPGFWRSGRAVNRELIIDVSQRPRPMSMYSTRKID